MIRVGDEITLLPRNDGAKDPSKYQSYAEGCDSRGPWREFGYLEVINGWKNRWIVRVRGPELKVGDKCKVDRIMSVHIHGNAKVIEVASDGRVW